MSPPTDKSCFRINPGNPSCCDYYAITGIRHQDVWNTQSECWLSPEANQPSELLNAVIWGYNRPNRKALAILPNDKLLFHTTRIDLKLRLQGISVDGSGPNSEEVVTLMAEIDQITGLTELTTFHPQPPTALSPFQPHAKIKFVYSLDRILGRVLSCEDACHKSITILNYVPPEFLRYGKEGMLPMADWPHDWPVEHSCSHLATNPTPPSGTLLAPLSPGYINRGILLSKCHLYPEIRQKAIPLLTFLVICDTIERWAPF